MEPEKQRIPITSINQLQEGMTIVANGNGDTATILNIHPAKNRRPATVVVRWDGVPTVNGIREHELTQLMAEASILE